MVLISEDVARDVGKELFDEYGDLLDKKQFNPSRSLDTIRDLEMIFLKKETKEDVKERLSAVFSHIPAMFEMMETFRIYRNRASHDIQFAFGREDVKLLLDMMLVLINSLIECGIGRKIWEDRVIE